MNPFFCETKERMRLVSLFVAVIATAALSCKDEAGEDVGSWVLQKFPQSTTYVYNSNTSPSPFSLNDTAQGALAHTMQQFWMPGTNYVLYNDEPPFQTTYNFSAAHAKAALLWDSTTAIAIFHSIPKFPVGPAESSSYGGLLENAWEYAQHVACVTLPIQEFPTIQSYLAAMSPNVYEGAFQEPSVIPTDACSYLTIPTDPPRILVVKPASYNVDIWASCVSEHFGTNLQVMSWIHGTMDGTVQNGTVTTDIANVTYPFGVSYTEWDNHAKWAIGAEPFVCVGDLNRVETQKVRGGAAMCWKDGELWTAWNAIV
jgi:deoxyribonuclease-2